MPDFRKVTETLSVSPQITEADLEAAAAQGFKTIICNRPDGEALGQPKSAALKAKAAALGLAYVELPFGGAPTQDIVSRQGAAIDGAEAPVLAFCRSGTRSITAWALSRAGGEDPDKVIAAAAEAGYDLSGIRRLL
ncbi:MAG: TIGR01244 family sulfur transferase [Pseudomonadota bacterium]